MTTEVEGIAKRLQMMAVEATELLHSLQTANDVGSVENSAMSLPSDSDIGSTWISHEPKLLLPSAEYLKSILKARAARASFFETDLFADPAWDMIIDLAIARVEGRQISVTSLCSASGVPSTTALRWISQMVEDGIFTRREDTQDRRRSLIALSDDATARLAQYFERFRTTLV